MSAVAPATERLLRRPEVQRLTGMSTATLYKMMKAGSFPRPRKVSANIVAWKLSEVMTFIEERPVAA